LGGGRASPRQEETSNLKGGERMGAGDRAKRLLGAWGAPSHSMIRQRRKSPRTGIKHSRKGVPAEDRGGILRFKIGIKSGCLGSKNRFRGERLRENREKVSGGNKENVILF